MNWNRPKKFDYNLIVIGAGAAGLVSSYIASTLKAKVALIERHKMGGDCLNTGCVPSKALIRTAKVLSLTKKAQSYGLKSLTAEFEFKDIMARVNQVIGKIEPNDSVERYTALGVDCILGDARITSPYTVTVNGRTLNTRAIIVATGAEPIVPDLPGLKEARPLTSENLWELSELPKELLVVGSGPIGCELAQSFARLGSNVTMLERNLRLLPREDFDVSQVISETFKSEGIRLVTGSELVRVDRVDGGFVAVVKQSDGELMNIPFDQILLALGRKPRLRGFGLEDIGVELNDRGQIAVDPFLATNIPNIYVCGDVTGPYQFTHMAAHQAYFASLNSLFGDLTRWLPGRIRRRHLAVNYSVVPWATYTDPEIATVGLTEESAKQSQVEYDLTVYPIHELDRAIADTETGGMVKVLTKPGSDQILGATIVGQHASDMITEFISAMKHGYGLNAILGTIHIYPTMSEANKYAAGRWKQKRKPEGVLRWLKRFHEWRRGE